MLSIVAVYACARCATVLARRFSVRFNKFSAVFHGGQLSHSQAVAEHRQRAVSVRKDRPKTARHNLAAQSGRSGHASDGVRQPLMERPIWCHHDHDEELGQFFYGDPPPQFPNAPKAANLTASAPAQKPQDKPRLVAKRSPAEPPKERAVTRQPANAGRQQSNSRPPAESTSANFRRPRDEAYWDEAGNLLLDYFELQAGARYRETEPYRESRRAVNVRQATAACS